MGKYIAEFVGTFFLMLSIFLSTNGELNQAFLAPIAVGATLIAIIYAGKHVSGAYYNPAVTIALMLRKKCSMGDTPIYIFLQLLATISASLISIFIFEKGIFLGANTALPTNLMAAITAELLGTIALVWVILHTATTASNEGNSFYGIAIGFVVVGLAYIFGEYGTGGCFNPAIALGAWFNGLLSFKTALLTIITNFIGGILGFYIFNVGYAPLHIDD